MFAWTSVQAIFATPGVEPFRESLSWGVENFCVLRTFCSSGKIISQIVIVGFIIGFS